MSNIRVADSKGRVALGKPGETYYVQEQTDGTTALHPVKIPKPTALDKNDTRAVYWNPSIDWRNPGTITIFSVIPGGGISSQARWVAEIANELMVPVVVSAEGIGRIAADALLPLMDRDVIEVSSL